MHAFSGAKLEKLDHLIVQDGDGGVRRQRDGRGRPDEVAHLLPDLDLGVAGEAPQDGVDQTLGDVLLDLVDAHGEVRVSVVVLLDIPHSLVEHRKEGAKSSQPN